MEKLIYTTMYQKSRPPYEECRLATGGVANVASSAMLNCRSTSLSSILLLECLFFTSVAPLECSFVIGAVLLECSFFIGVVLLEW